MIKDFRHKGLERFYRAGSKAGIQPEHAEKLRDRLLVLDNVVGPEDAALPGWNLHALHGELSGYWSIRVNGNWRLTFAFEGEDVVFLNYQDYH